MLLSLQLEWRRCNDLVQSGAVKEMDLRSSAMDRSALIGGVLPGNKVSGAQFVERGWMQLPNRSFKTLAGVASSRCWRRHRSSIRCAQAAANAANAVSAPVRDPAISPALDGEAGSSGAKGSRRLKAVVVGAGVGGLAVAGRLAKEGFDVHILEKNKEVGGRLQSLVVEAGEDGGAYRFDTGPSLLLFPQVYRDAFTAMGADLEDYVPLKKVEPAAYRVFFARESSQIDPTPECRSLDLLYDVHAMCAQLEKVEAGAGGNFLRFLAKSKAILDNSVDAIIKRDCRSLLQYGRNMLQMLPVLQQVSPLELLGPHDTVLSSFFSSPKIRALFTFQDLYVGLSPYSAPGVFSLLAATELVNGVWYPEGGFVAIRDALQRVAQEKGVTIRTDAPVRRILQESGRVTGVALEDGSQVPADIVVANADLPYVYNSLLGQEGSANSRGQELAKWEYSAGIISFNWAIDGLVEGLCHHNVFLSDAFKQSWTRARDPGTLLAHPNFYVHGPARTDSGAAPSGGDALTVLVPVAHLGEGYSGDPSKDASMVDATRAAVLDTLAKAGLGDLKSRILSEVVYSPPQWEQSYNLYNGAAFGLAHGFFQLAFFRPDVADPAVQGLYFAGASTRPGNGVPLVLMGADVTAKRILQDVKDRTQTSA